MSEDLDLTVYLALLWRYKFLLLATTLLAMLAAIALSLIRPPTYEAVAGVAVVPSQSRITFDPRFETVQDTAAARDPEARRRSLAQLVQNPAIEPQVRKSLADEYPELPENLVRNVMGEASRSDVINIRVEADSPALATALANAWAIAYVEYVNRLYNTRAQPPEALTSQLEQVRKEYMQAQKTLTDFIAQSPRIELERQTAAVMEIITDVSALEKLEAIARSTPEERLPSLTRALLLIELNRGGIAGENLPSIIVDTSLLNNANPPEDAFEQIAEALRSRREAVLKVAQQSMQAPGEVFPATVDLTTVINELRQKQADLQQEIARENELRLARDTLWDSYQTLSRKVQEERIASATMDTEVRFALPAIPPRSPASPNVIRNALLGAFLGFLVGLAAAFVELVRERLYLSSHDALAQAGSSK